MCGIVGIAGDISYQDELIFRTLLDLDVIRGRDSTGVALVGKEVNSKVITAKAVGTPTSLYRSSKLFARDCRPTPASKCLIGHNRAATMGAIDLEGAHPFTFDHITGVHNGTLRDWFDLEGYYEFSVDSQAIYKDISIHGIDKTWGKFTGAAALVWWDDIQKSLNLVRNSERPLYLAWFNGGKTIIWASEKWMIHAALCTVDKKVDEGIEGVSNPFQLKEHSLHTFTIQKDFKPYLANVKDLKPRYEPRFRSQSYSNVVGIQNTYKDFNYGWAKNLDKGDKALIGMEFKFIKGSLITYSHRSLYINTAKTLDGRTVHVYPSCIEDWNFYCDMVNDPEMEDNIYAITHRPRLKQRDGETVYCVGDGSFSLVKGIEFEWEDDSKLKEEATKLEEAGNSCAFCQKSLTIDDEYRYIFHETVAVCPDCEDQARGYM